MKLRRKSLDGNVLRTRKHARVAAAAMVLRLHVATVCNTPAQHRAICGMMTDVYTTMDGSRQALSWRRLLVLVLCDRDPSTSSV